MFYFLVPKTFIGFLDPRLAYMIKLPHPSLCLIWSDPNLDLDATHISAPLYSM